MSHPNPRSSRQSTDDGPQPVKSNRQDFDELVRLGDELADEPLPLTAEIRTAGRTYVRQGLPKTIEKWTEPTGVAMAVGTIVTITAGTARLVGLLQEYAAALRPIFP